MSTHSTCASATSSAPAPVLARVVHGGEPYRSEQGTVYQPGISAQTVGASSLFLGMVTLPPLERTRAHVHAHHESAFFVLSGGEIELWSGEGLQDCATVKQGDYLFIPRNVPHVAVNRSATQPAVFIGVRDEATAQESVAMRPELDACVP
jgi:uncharacterized RmlC-like cupin family protein